MEKHKVLRKIHLKEEKFKILCNEELPYSYRSPSIVTIIKSGRVEMNRPYRLLVGKLLGKCLVGRGRRGR
jgi:hypothetical protein